MGGPGVLSRQLLGPHLQGLFQTLRPSVFVDPMVGGGTSLDVARDMRIDAYGLDLHSGFSILKEPFRRAEQPAGASLTAIQA